MAAVSARTAPALRNVLWHFGIGPAALHNVRSGRVNRHWRVVVGDETYVLRRYDARRTPAAIRYEHVVLRHLAGAGWPVAAPLPAADGETLVELDGQRYALFRFLPGRPPPYRSRRYQRLKGRLLARLHGDLAAWEAPGQREGFGRLWELDVYVRAWTPLATFDELLMAFGRQHPALARAIRAHEYASLRELSTLGYGELPAMPCHFDFHHDNLLFQRGELTGLLDFDLVHLDARVADLATSIASDCRAAPAYNEIDPEAARAFVGGYAELSPLTDDEAQLVVPFARAYLLWLIAFRLGQWVESGSEDALRSIERTVGARLRSYVEGRATLEAAVLQAVASHDR